MTDNLNNFNEVSDTQVETIVELSDDALQSISGGCTSSCGGGRTTSSTSCVPPGVQCP